MAAQTPSGSQATKFPAAEELERQDAQPGKEHKMAVKPETLPKHYKPAGKLEGKKALITGEGGSQGGVQILVWGACTGWGYRINWGTANSFAALSAVAD